VLVITASDNNETATGQRIRLSVVIYHVHRLLEMILGRDIPSLFLSHSCSRFLVPSLLPLSEVLPSIPLPLFPLLPLSSPFPVTFPSYLFSSPVRLSLFILYPLNLAVGLVER